MEFNYNSTYDQQIIEMRRSFPHGWMGKIHKCTEFKYLKDYVLENTKFLDVIPFKFTFATRVWYVINRLQSVHKCPVCGKPVLRNVETLPNKNTRTVEKFCCSLACTSRNAAIMEERKKTNLEKYGCEWVAQTEWHKKMAVEGCLRHYGVKYYTQTNEYKNSEGYKRNVERLKTKEVKQHAVEALQSMSKDRRLAAVTKCQTSRRTKYYNEKYTNNPEVNMMTPFEEYMKMNTKKDVFRWKCNKCGNEFESRIDFNWALHDSFKLDNINRSYARCEHCHPYNKEYSFGEIELKEFVEKICKSHGYTVLNQTPMNRQIIPPYEIDIYIPEIKLGIEYNGVFWHSLQCMKMNGSHRKTSGICGKSEQCDQIGVSLIHIYEDEWQHERDSVEDYLRHVINDDVCFPETFPMKLSRDKFPIPFLEKRFKVVEKSGPEEKTAHVNGTYTIMTSGSITIERKSDL